MLVRSASIKDAAAIAHIYNQGIEDRVATFETSMRTKEDVESWFDTIYPVVVVEDEGDVIAFGSTSSYSHRICYVGIAECSVYVRREKRGCGAGRMALDGLIEAAEAPSSGSSSHGFLSRIQPVANSSALLDFARLVCMKSMPNLMVCG